MSETTFNDDVYVPGCSQMFKKVFCDASHTLKFIFIVGSLKNLKRAGWVKQNVKQSESVADHMYRMAMLCLLLPKTHVDINKCIKMALVHDLAESLVGDITPDDNVPHVDKSQWERKALRKIVGFLDDVMLQQEIIDLWEEYEKGETQEALFVGDADKFDMITTALEYESQHGNHLDQFYLSTRACFKTDFFRDLQHQLVRLRESCLKRRLPTDSDTVFPYDVKETRWGTLDIEPGSK